MAKKRKISLFFLPFVAAIPLVLWGVLQDTITRNIGPTGWSIGMGVLVAVVVAASLLPVGGLLVSVFGGGGYNYFWGSGKKAKEILVNGRSAKAPVVGIGEHSGGGTLTINNQPVLNLTLQIDDDYNQPYQTSFDVLIPRSAVPQFQPGAMFAVRVDLNDPQMVVFDPEGMSRIQGMAGAGAQPSVGGKTWTEADRVLLKQDGKDGMAKILVVEDTGRSEDFNPVVRLSYEVYLPGEEPYNVTKEVPMPTAYVQQLKNVIGKTFPARVHPKDKTKISVNITF